MKFRKNENDEALDVLIDCILQEMQMVGRCSEEYSKLMKSLERLHELKANNRPKRVSRDTIAIVAGNLLGILLIVSYEHAHVMTSKSFSQLPKLNPKLPET